MLQKAAAVGVETVVATPHLMRGTYEIQSCDRDRLTADLQRAANDNGIAIQVKPGVEYYLSSRILWDDDSLREFTVNNNGRYVLIEFPLQFIPPGSEDILFKLRVQGVTPVLAHPERCHEIREKPEILFDIVNQGCLTQLNAGSLIGEFGNHSRKTARILLDHGLIHAIASDMHSPFCHALGEFAEIVEKIAGTEGAVRMLSENPRRIVEGKELDTDPPIPFGAEKKGLKRFFPRNKG